MMMMMMLSLVYSLPYQIAFGAVPLASINNINNNNNTAGEKFRLACINNAIPRGTR